MFGCLIITRVSSEKEKSFRENFAFFEKKIFATISLRFCISFDRKKCKHFRFFSRNFASIQVSRKKCEIFAKQKMRKFRGKNNAKISRKKIMRKFRAKIMRKFCKKIEIMRKNTKFLRKLNKNLKRQLEKSNSLHQTFIKVKEEQLLI